ncbi:zinc finger MYM-type protein 1-like [Rhopalosiphum padi]|uniref:zinc finger MYM-type protein 1-like n=1 Tax=Rhopalosiphum padi TaxID=40932 RepID=UPI00298E0D83|nr:zinc finger MYM-type protein 1-like [Rhopalosiphum padi]
MRKQRQQREEMKQKLPKMDKFLTKTKCDISTVSTEMENVDSSDDRPFPKDPHQSNRSFSESYYIFQTKYGPVNRFWLCYSPLLDATYCQPCWLFSLQRSTWCTGLRDWKHLSERNKEHGFSKNHIEACAVCEMWQKNINIDKDLENQIRKEASFWRMVLQRLFDIIITLATNSLALRGHREDLSLEGYHGNFLLIVQLVSRYDQVLNQVLEMPKGSTRYLSPTVQNEMIECIGKTLEGHLLENIRASPFFAIIMDTTQDIAKVDQLSIVVRYAAISRSENGQPVDIKVKEVFLGFYAVTKHSAVDLVKQVITLFSHKNLDLKKCVGQGYDGASVMSGRYNSVQKHIKDIQPNAEYVHCASHNLNLVINDAVRGCMEIQHFFITLQELYNFFGNSIKRWDLLSKFTSESEVTLKKLNPTRWSSRINTITTVKLRFFDIIKSLSEIALNSKNVDERNEADNIKKKLFKFEFVLLCEFMYRVLNNINYASKILQKVDIDLDQASNVLEETKDKLKMYRNYFESFYNKATETARKYDIDLHFQVKRQSKIKKHFDELASDHRFDNRKEIFKITIFNNILDIIITQLNTRFIGMSKVNKIFDFLTPKVLRSIDERTLLQKCDQFQSKYSDVIGPNFSLQFLNVYHLTFPELTETCNVYQLCKDIITKFGVMECDITEVFMAILLFYTIPVTSAGAERSFSKLKIIKNYLRNSTGQDRLKYLSLIAVENKAASKLDLSEVIDQFANIKARKRL